MNDNKTAPEVVKIHNLTVFDRKLTDKEMEDLYRRFTGDPLPIQEQLDR